MSADDQPNPSAAGGEKTRTAGNFWVVGHLTSTERLLLFAAIFVVPFIFLTALYVAQSWNDIQFVRAELIGSAELMEIWPGFQANIGRAYQPANTDRPLAAPGHAERLDLAGARKAFVPDRPWNRASAELGLMAHVADVSKLTLDRNLDSYYLGSAVSVGLPRLMAAAADAKSVSALSPDQAGRTQRLTIDEAEVRAAALDVQSALDKAAQATGRREDRQAIEAANLALRQALTRAEGLWPALASNRPGAGEALDDLQGAADRSWRASRRQLDLILQARVDGLVRALALNLLIVALLLAAAAYLASAIHRHVNDRFKALVGVMARLIEGDATVEVPCLGDRDETGRIAEALAAFKQTLIERASLEEDSLAATRAKVEFLGNVSHEIRTPLNGIIGMASALARTRLTKAQREMVEVIFRSGHAVERLLADILDMSRIESGGLQLELRPFHLPDMMVSIVDQFRAEAELKGVGLDLAFAGEVAGEFEGDDVRLTQIVANLISNALKFTDEGEVAVTVALEAAAPTASTCELVITVKDSGTGFDQASAPFLFERFTQADSSIARRHGGSGLGLPISKALLELMGGSIEASSAKGVGSQFVVRVPLRRLRGLAATALRDGAAPELKLVDAPRPMRILVAEDHPVNRLVLQCMLEPLGVSLIMASDGADAVRRFRDERFDLVLMDVQMPVMDGLAATRAMRAVERERGGAHTPIAMITANVSSEHQIAAIAAGADAHLGKPVDQDLLWELVGAVAAGGFPGPADQSAPAQAG